MGKENARRKRPEQQPRIVKYGWQESNKTSFEQPSSPYLGGWGQCSTFRVIIAVQRLKPTSRSINERHCPEPCTAFVPEGSGTFRIPLLFSGLRRFVYLVWSALASYVTNGIACR